MILIKKNHQIEAMRLAGGVSSTVLREAAAFVHEMDRSFVQITYFKCYDRNQFFRHTIFITFSNFPLSSLLWCLAIF